VSGLPVGAVAVVGPTASGKSSVAMAVAEAAGDIELISIDSMQVYRSMNIGTATPSSAEQALVPHHLIDLVDASDEFTVAEFQQAFQATLTDLSRRDRRSILVGGTGLYHRAAIDDLDLPGEWPVIRQELNAEVRRHGVEPLHRRLATIDPVAASRMEPTNERRVVRALEVCLGSGQAFSSFGPGLGTYPKSAIPQIGLRWPREVLADRVELRVSMMMEGGLLAEVEQIAASTGFSRTAAQALGYKELLAHLDGSVSLDEAVDQIVVRTRQFAVRQLRWFQRDPRVRWVDIEHDPVAEAVPIVRKAFTS
jgi:tRNA dimethylallyltransferase